MAKNGAGIDAVETALLDQRGIPVDERAWTEGDRRVNALERRRT